MNTEQLTKEQIEAEVAKIKYWHHCIDLGQGVFTKTGKRTEISLKKAELGFTIIP